MYLFIIQFDLFIYSFMHDLVLLAPATSHYAKLSLAP